MGPNNDLSTKLLVRLKPDPQRELPKVRQLYERLYEAITSGELPEGFHIPPTRDLADRLSIGRNTVVAVYEQLTAEGLLRGDRRRGTVVTYRASPLQSQTPATWRLSRRSSRVHPARTHSTELAPGEPDTSLFPSRAWGKALARASRLKQSRLGYRLEPLPEIQTAIARYLATFRSLVVEPKQVVVTASTRQSLLLSATLFADRGDVAWMETPGYLGAVDAFRQQGLIVKPCAVDREGLVPIRAKVPPKLLYVTPCFQFPLAMPLSAARRETLLTLSSNRRTVIFEDDYDSEFRNDAQPRPALAAANAAARVLHSGTFSKLMFPAVRVAWLVVPAAHAEAAHQCLRTLGGGVNSVAQAAVAELLDSGEVARHLARARQVYAKRSRLLIECLEGSHTLKSATLNGSLSLIIPLKRSVSLLRLEGRLKESGLGAVPLERMQWDQSISTRCRKLVVGLGNVDSMSIPEIVQRLDRAVARA